MAREEGIEFIDLSDFTPGISSSYHSNTGDEPKTDGAARVDETYGCYGLVDGGLAPLPRITLSRIGGVAEPTTGYEWPTAVAGLVSPNLYNGLVAVLDAHVVSPIEYEPPVEQAVDLAFPPVSICTVRQWYTRKISDGTINTTWAYRGNPEYADNDPLKLVGRGINVSDVDVTWAPNPSRWKFGWGSVTEVRTQAEGVDGTLVGYPVIVSGMGGVIKVGAAVPSPGAIEGQDVATYFSYPDMHATDAFGIVQPSDLPYEIPTQLGIALPGMVFGHQGRLLAIGRRSGYLFAKRTAYHGQHYGQRASETIFYSPPNQIYDRVMGQGVFGEENGTGFGSWSSVNANSLLLIRNRGGAVQINGDIARPTVVRLPGVPSTGGVANRGANTDQGYAYGSKSGVWMWAGSDSATNISPTLNPEFWVPDDVTVPLRELGQLVGSFAYRHPYLYAPNNWVMDMRKGGWFRYHPTPEQDSADGRTMAFNEIDSNGDLWAFPASYIVNVGTLYNRFSIDTPRNTYQWRSQPLVRSRNRYLKYRSITLVASGKGDVTVDIIGLDGASNTESFDVTHGGVQQFVRSVGLTTTDVEIRIRSSAALATDSAPIVHRVSLGYMEAQSLGRTGTRGGG